MERGNNSVVYIVFTRDPETWETPSDWDQRICWGLYGMDIFWWNSNPVLPISVSDQASAAPLQSRNKALVAPWTLADTEEACKAAEHAWTRFPGESVICCWKKGDNPQSTKIVESYFCECIMNHLITECPKNQQTTTMDPWHGSTLSYQQKYNDYGK